MIITSILLTLSGSLFWTTSVFADGETPPPTETPAVTEQSDSPLTESGDEDSTESIVLTDGLDSTTENSDPEITLPTKPADNLDETGSTTQDIEQEVLLTSEPIDENILLITDLQTTDALLEQVPDGTQVIILDESGNVLPLASEEAAEIAANGDPIWCPVGVAPVATAGGCTDSFTLFNGGLIPALSGKTTAGVIWIAAGYDSSGEGGSITLDGSLGSTVNYALSIQGGWNGVSGSKTIIGTSTIGVPLVINWNADVTINDLIITGVTGSGSTALTITTPKIIKLTRIQVDSNDGSGADIENQTGTGTVTISSSEFSGNLGGDGLVVQSKGLITLTDITGSNNGGNGATVSNNFVGVATGVTLTGSNVFSENVSAGLEVNSRGIITVSNLIADLNGDWGAILDNSDALTALAVTVKGSSNEFKYNGSGLKIESKGVITLNSITADYNLAGRGVDLRNDQPGSISIVSITGTNSFSDNFDTGLYLLSYGNITINNITANTNGGDGVFLDNSSAITPKGITLTGINSFSSNSGNGLKLQSDGAILVNSITASDNGEHGVSLSNDSTGAVGSVILNVYGKFNNNGWSGLVISSKGAVTLNNLTANDNGQANVDPTLFPYNDYGYGASVFNAFNSSAPQNVTVNGTNIFNGNWLSGVELSTFGGIITNNLTAGGNGVGNYSDTGFGALLDNCITVTPGSCSAITAKTIAIKGTNSFISNYNTGLVAYSFGAITANGITVKEGENGGGASIENGFTNSVGAVSLTGSNYFINNYYDGLAVTSFGAITLNNITATGNGDGAVDAYGINLNNSGSVNPFAVKLTGASLIDGNNAGGLYIDSKGAITLAKITASNSILGSGAKLDNTFGILPQNVTVTGINIFSGNYKNGIEITTTGLITLSSVTANDNGWGLDGGFGALLDNDGASIPKAVTLTGTNSFVGNGSDGINISTKGPITLNIVEASSNGGTGAVLDNNLTGAVGGVTVIGKGCTYNANSGYGCFNGNGENGLDITSKGIITLTMMNVQNNVGHGASLNNSAGTGGIIMKIISGYDSANQFSENGTYGLNAITHGVITIVTLRASYNTTYGAILDNSDSATPLALTLSGGSLFTNNGGNGLEVISKGLITVANLVGKNNDGYGAILDNTDSGPSLPQNLSLSGTNSFSNNDYTGLKALSYGIITISNLSAVSNGTASILGQGYGAYVQNYWDGVTPADHPATITAKQVTLSGLNTLSSNFDDGLNVTTKGAFIGNAITANSNGGNGAYIKNQSGAGSIGGISLTGTNSFEENASLGIQVYSNGAITINNLIATLNEGGNVTNGDGTFAVGGVYLENWSLTAIPVKITLTGSSSFTDNGNSLTHMGTGLVIYSDGAITLNNITSSGNANSGVILNNDYYSISPAAITLTGYNKFMNNYGDGLYFESSGIVSLTRIRSDGNGDDGVEGSADGNIKLTCASMTNNDDYGWYLTSSGTITLVGVFGIGNTSGTYSNVTPAITRSCPLP
jgi:hypothetical protein